MFAARIWLGAKSLYVISSISQKSWSSARSHIAFFSSFGYVLPNGLIGSIRNIDFVFGLYLNFNLICLP